MLTLLFPQQYLHFLRRFATVLPFCAWSMRFSRLRRPPLPALHEPFAAVFARPQRRRLVGSVDRRPQAEEIAEHGANDAMHRSVAEALVGNAAEMRGDGFEEQCSIGLAQLAGGGHDRDELAVAEVGEESFRGYSTCGGLRVSWRGAHLIAPLRRGFSYKPGSRGRAAFRRPLLDQRSRHVGPLQMRFARLAAAQPLAGAFAVGKAGLVTAVELLAPECGQRLDFGFGKLAVFVQIALLVVIAGPCEPELFGFVQPPGVRPVAVLRMLGHQSRFVALP